MDKLLKRFGFTSKKQLPLDAVLELCDEGFVVIAHCLKVVNSNARAEQIFSLSKKDLVGRDIKLLLSEWDKIAKWTKLQFPRTVRQLI